MNYDPTHQQRCIIIRGKSQSKMEDMLPLYANTVHKICPCTKEEFVQRAYREFSLALFGTSDYEHLPESNRKTVRNHATEIPGALLNLYYYSEDGLAQESDSCKMLLEKRDYPLFFKNLCLNFQFPNGANKEQSYTEYLKKSIHIKPYCYVVSLLYYAQSQKDAKLLTKQEVAYYVLNNLDALRGNVPVKTIYESIMNDRVNKNVHPKLQGSKDYQHIKEQYNLLELANIISTDNTYIWLNKEEAETIKLFLKETDNFIFDAYKYDISTVEGRRKYEHDWRFAYSHVDSALLAINKEPTFSIKGKEELVAERGAVGQSTTEIGNAGEALVYKMEKERVTKYKPRLANKVILFGKVKGLGYDVHSIEADENTEFPEFDRYIEVKTTTRMTEPSFDNVWMDSVDITAKEWVAAQQYKEYYNIYRVYFTKKSVIVIRINNPYQLSKEGKVEVYPTAYQMIFGRDVIERRSYEQKEI